MPAYYGDFVIPAALCTSQDVAGYTGTAAPANITALIRSATRMILRETRQAYYVVDPATGLAVDTYIGQALHDATVVQVAAWIALGVNPLLGGVITTGTAQSKRFGAGSVNYADAKIAADAKQRAIDHLVPEAERILEMANLLIPNPWTFG